MMRVLWLLVSLVAFAPAWGETTRPSRPAAFGESKEGLAVALAARPDNPLILTATVKNDGVTEVPLKGSFVWLLVAESRETAYFTDRVSLDAHQPTLPAGQEIPVMLDLHTLQAAAYQKGMKVVGGYPQGELGQMTVAIALAGKNARAQAIVYLSAGGEKLTLRSPAAQLHIPSGKPSLTAAGGEVDSALLDRFRHDAFAAKAAHDEAVKQGAKALATLIAGLNDTAMPDYGRMWMATAVAEVGGEEAAKTLTALVADPSDGVRGVVAYYGPRMKSPAVDQAILVRCQSGTDPVFIAWAARGFAEAKRPFPPELVAAAATSKEPRARAEIAEALASSQRPADLKRLAGLCSDDNELVRVAAADAVGKHGIQDSNVLRAMSQSLDRSGESARQRTIQALAKLSHQAWTYDPADPPEKRHALIAQVQRWCTGR